MFGESQCNKKKTLKEFLDPYRVSTLLRSCLHFYPLVVENY